MEVLLVFGLYALLMGLLWIWPTVVAYRMGRDRDMSAGGLLIGLFFGWLGVIVLAFIPKSQQLQAQAVKVMPAYPGSAHGPGYAGPASNTIQADAADYKDCPMCAEKVRVSALRCRHCQADLSQAA